MRSRSEGIFRRLSLGHMKRRGATIRLCESAVLGAGAEGAAGEEEEEAGELRQLHLPPRLEGRVEEEEKEEEGVWGRGMGIRRDEDRHLQQEVSH